MLVILWETIKEWKINVRKHLKSFWELSKVKVQTKQEEENSIRRESLSKEAWTAVNVGPQGLMCSDRFTEGDVLQC